MEDFWLKNCSGVDEAIMSTAVEGNINEHAANIWAIIEAY